MNFLRSVDLFCRVIDNFGDVGVCWRLARQLAVEENLQVRLYLDDLASLYRIVPEPDQSVQLVKWVDDLVYTESADLVIEAFACDLPDQVIEAMKERDRPPVWIDLEYLTAEDWALSCHAIPSVHPSTGLQKTLFFPGFVEESGGLLRENDLIERRDGFQSDVFAQNQWRRTHNLPEFDENCIDLSFFSYKTAPIEAFFDELSEYSRAVRVFYPVLEGFGVEKRGYLTIYRVPFFSQSDYDYLLWTCDGNFVRGEDSFVRAGFAAKPMIWNIYVQENDAHLVKMRAFLDLYRAAFLPNVWEGLAESFYLWNLEGEIKKGVWKILLDNLPVLTQGARLWADGICSQDALVTKLLEWYKNNNILIKKDKL
ncbi:MAG: elongation factor P maturation arginine rhamnosyltransferase EarP [Alphaproteobacteria bacterium]|nr:elongation factor P maturation arginine rhamnosyltransferase EarP [Alphaproteobacteria bacterium]